MGNAKYPLFVGTVLRVEDRPGSGATSFLSTRKAYFQVNESFGGVAPEAREIEVLTGRGGGDCGIPFKPGDVYLVAASAGEDGLLRTGICGPTRKIEAAGALLRVLRQQRDGKAPPSLVGRILQQDRDYKGRLNTHLDKPLAKTTLRLKSSTGVFETISDAEGIYEFQELPSGRYEFDPVLPPGTTLAWYLGSERPRESFQLSGLGCQEQNVQVFASGSIEGRVLDSANRPLPDISVYLVSADQPIATDWRDRYREYQGKEGRFKFLHLSPGRYQVVVNPDDTMDATHPYPRTFHPGVHDREAATVITVGAGEQVKDADIRLQQQFVPRHVAVRVKWADGQSIQSFVYIVASGITNPKLRSDARNDEKESVGDLKLVPTESYAVEARLTCRYADATSVGPGATLISNAIEVKPEDGQTDIILTIPATACPEIEGKTRVRF